MLSVRNKRFVSMILVMSLWVSCICVGFPNSNSNAYAEEGSQSVAVTGLVGEWKFDEVTLGGISPDTLLRNNSTLTGAALGTGKVGKALLLNGYSNYATVPNQNLINTGSDFSMSLFVNFNSPYTNRNVVIVQQQGEGGETLLSRRPDGRLQSSLGGKTTIGDTLIEPKNWYHIALVRESDLVKLYVNGALETVTEDTLLISNIGDFRIGADREPEVTNAWPGYVDELKIYDKALTNEEMKQIPGFSWPIISLKGDSEIELSLNDTYVDSGATASDASGKNITDSIQTTGQVDTSKGGIYKVIYTVPSSDGVSISKVRTVTVTPPKTLSRASRVLIDKGLQMQTWMTTDETKRTYASADEWTGSNFTTATYYEYPGYNKKFHEEVPGAQWSYVKGAFGDGLGGGPKKGDMDGFLEDAQKDNVNNLITISFGDEESYSPEILKTFTDWFKLSHDLYPNVLAHSNQQSRQWQRDDYETYIRTAEPDLLTFDDYLFTTIGSDNNHFTTIVNNINDQRTIALKGYDGTGQSPIAFGQYLLGFKTGGYSGDTGSYIITESQIYGVPFATLTLGGKWLSLFRWEYDSRYFLLFDKDGKPTEQYYQYAEMAKQIKNLGPHLVRLNSTDTSIVPGQHKDENGKVVKNLTPRETPVFDKNNQLKHPYLKSIVAKNTSIVAGDTSDKEKLNGDVLLGFFEPLPDTQDFFKSADMEYFMIMNGLTSGNGKTVEQQKGKGTETEQTITVKLNLAKYSKDAIKKVSRLTGELESVALKPLGGNLYELKVVLNGGVADLFQLDKAKVNASYIASDSLSLPEAFRMNAGETIALEAAVSPAEATEKSVNWYTSNEQVATVDSNGNVTAKAGGKAVITALSVDGNKKATVTITVSSVNVPVTGITVTPSTAKLFTEETLGLNAVVLPNNATNKAYDWSSSDINIATVDQNGIVIAKAPGSVDITAKTSDGLFQAKSTITVLDMESDASLSELIVDDGRTNIPFDSEVFDYTTTINSKVDTITLQPRLKNNEGTITVNDTTIVSGQLITAEIPMGNSKIVIVTTAADGITKKTYTLTVKRNKNLALEATVVSATYLNKEGEAADKSRNDYDNASEHSPLKFADGKIETYFQSVEYKKKESGDLWGLNGKGEFDPANRIMLQWDDDNLQDFNKLVLVVNNAQQQGLTVMDTQTTVDGTKWDELNKSAYKPTWQTDSPDIYEKITIDLPNYKEEYGNDYKGLKGIFLLLWAANLNAEHKYAISEFELYNEQDATEPVKLIVSDIPATAIQIEPGSLELLVHNTAKLTASFTPANATDKKVEWSSSDERVATVNKQGIVTAIQAGKAMITAKTNGNLTSKSEITVTNPNSDASLATLKVNGGNTNISFNSSTTDYTLSLDPSVDTITLVPELNKTNGTMKVNGISVRSGQLITAKVPMGNSKIAIVTLAADRFTTKTYTLTVKRNKNLALEATVVSATYLNKEGEPADLSRNDYDNASEHSPLKFADGKVETYFQSVENKIKKQGDLWGLNGKGEFDPANRIMLQWDDDNLQDFNKLVLVVNNAQQQGLTVFNIQTSVNGTEWDEIVGTASKPTWQTDSPDIYEKITIDLPNYKEFYEKEGKDYKGVKGIYLLLWAANLKDHKYAISEFELYNEQDATEPVLLTVSDIPVDPENPNDSIVADWVFTEANVQSGTSIAAGNLVIKDRSGNNNDLKMASFGEFEGKMLSFTDDGAVEFANARKAGDYFTTVEKAPINTETFKKGFTIEAEFKLGSSVNKWMGILTRQGVNRFEAGNEESLSTLSISEIPEVQWASTPGDLSPNSNSNEIQTNWSNSLSYIKAWAKSKDYTHVAIVNDGTKTRLFLNGIESIRNPQTDGIINGIAAEVGKGWNVGASEWDGKPNSLYLGKIKHIRVSDKALEKDQFFKTEFNYPVDYGTNNDLPMFAPDTYTFAIIPDPQYVVQSKPEILEKQLQFIADNHISKNIAMTLNVGDTTQSSAAKEWASADKAFKILDNAKVPYIVTRGNHDTNGTGYIDTMGPKRFSETEHFQGASPSGLSTYSIITAGSYKYMFLAVDSVGNDSSNTTERNWAKTVLNENPNIPTVIFSHNIMTIDDSGQVSEGGQGSLFWSDLVENYDQVFMMVGGHISGAGLNVKKNAKGKDVLQVLTDYQSDIAGGNGWTSFFEFDEKSKEIRVKTFSPYVDSIPVGERSYLDTKFLIGPGDMYSIPFNFSSRFIFTKNDTTSPPVIIIPDLTNGKGSIKLNVPNVDARTGEAKAVVEERDLNKALSTAPTDDNGVKTVKVEVPKANKPRSYVVELPKAALTADQATHMIEITTEFGTITVPANMLQGQDLSGAKTVAIVIAKVDQTSLDPALQQQIGARPVIEVDVYIDGVKVAWNNPQARVKVTVPYKAADAELADPEHIVVSYISNAGIATPVSNGKYDSAKATVTFTTTHFSKYAVMFVHKTFEDLEKVNWAKKQIEVLASKGIINGMSETKYNPSASITRADFIVLLVRALELTAATDSSFTDVNSSAYYYNEVMIAKKLGITNGTGNNKFNPLQPITRQDAFVLLHKAMKVSGLKLNEDTSSELDHFNDKTKVANYATESLAIMVKNGIIQGNGKYILPLDSLSRAETAVVLYNMINK